VKNDNLAAKLACNPFDAEKLKLIIDSIPANVFFKDTDCRYQMASRVCEQLNGGDEDWTIVGKTDLEVQNDPELAKFYYEDDKKIIESREGSHYISEMVFDGEKYYYEITKEPVIDAGGNVIGVVGLVNDITELKRLQEELRLMSITDTLTGVYNRTYYEQKLAELSANRCTSLSIIMCDTNGLKFFNDTFGHQKGDALLLETVSMLNDAVGDACEIMRIGGDEFVILCPDCSEDECKVWIEEMRKQEKETKVFGLPISNAYGYAALKGDEYNLLAALGAAEEMMYQEKALIKADYLQQLQELCSAK
jgi:diguanylate cyclase (GGDEF)-like protein/PAS domain S-box-containing protein